MHCKEINNSLKPQGKLAPTEFAMTKHLWEKKKKKAYGTTFLHRSHLTQATTTLKHFWKSDWHSPHPRDINLPRAFWRTPPGCHRLSTAFLYHCGNTKTFCTELSETSGAPLTPLPDLSISCFFLKSKLAKVKVTTCQGVRPHISEALCRLDGWPSVVCVNLQTMFQKLHFLSENPAVLK